jgi:hypothetical protein
MPSEETTAQAAKRTLQCYLHRVGFL